MNPIRLVLTPDQTAELVAQAGHGNGNVFACIGPGSIPDGAGRLVVYFIPGQSVEAVNGAVRVAQGVSKERRPRKVKG